MISAWHFLIALAAALGADVPIARRAAGSSASTEQKSESADATKVDDARDPRIEFLMRAAQKFEVRVGDDRELSPLKREPLMNWTNPVSGTTSGVLVMYSRGGRPDLVAQFSYPGSQPVHEFHHGFDGPLVMTRGESEVWKPQSSLTQWGPLDSREAPARTPQLRLVQMRRLAAEFHLEDDFGWTTKTLQPLRLLTSPIYRYGKPGEEIEDGAVFAWTVTTDPEALLLIECFHDKEGLAWRYALTPMTIYALKATRKNAVVWEVPERRVFNDPGHSQFVGNYRLDADDSLPR